MSPFCHPRPQRLLICGCALLIAFCTRPVSTWAQGPIVAYGSGISPEVRGIYERGLEYLAKSQEANGSWASQQAGPGITGLCLMAFLAHGDDPNGGRYSANIRRGVRHLLEAQDRNTGYFGNSMYHHGFSMLALAEAYGAVDESLLWDEGAKGQSTRSIGKGLELAVRCAVTAQKRNSAGGWRYSPEGIDADTSVSGAVLMGLLAARNAGIEVPDECIDKGLKYYQSSTSEEGSVAYANDMGGFGSSMNRSAIATLVYSVGKHKDWKEYKATLEYIASKKDDEYQEGYPCYFRYYMAQALFQGAPDSWQQWRKSNAEHIAELQAADGSISDSFGPACGTSMYLLSLALEYRFLPIYER